MPWGPDVETNLAIRSANHLKVQFIQQNRPEPESAQQKVAADSLRKGDYVRVDGDDIIPCDGAVLAGGDFASVTGGTRILSDWLVIRCSVNPGETFLDRMIAMV